MKLKYVSKRAIEEFVLEQRDGRIEKTFGPSVLNDCQVWEVWVYVTSESEYYSRYVLDDGHVLEGGSVLMYFSEFQQFVVYADNLLPQNENMLLIKQKTLLTYVAAFVFVACALTLLVLLALDRVQGVAGFSLLAGLVASGARMFFGDWVQPLMPKS